MKTEDLIAMLSTNVEPVDRWRVPRTIITVVVFGALTAALLVLAMFGARSDLGGSESLPYLSAKLVFTLTVVALSSIYLSRVARPGGERKTSLLVIALPFVAIIGLAAVALAGAPRAHWHASVIGDQWIECLVSIPLIAVVPFALIIWAARQAMPTDLRKAGTLAGLAAGGLSATGYALHCVDDSVPFVALWYGGTIAVCAVAGALLGPRLLRW